MRLIDSRSFEAEVRSCGGIVVVDFWSPKCEECLGAMPWIEELERKYDNRVKFCSVDVSVSPRLALSQGVRGLPTVCIYQDGKKIAALSGRDFSPGTLASSLSQLSGGGPG